MKATLVTLFSVLSVSTSWANERHFDCLVSQVKNKKQPIHEDIQLEKTPRFVLDHKFEDWKAQIGEMILDPEQANGPSLIMKSTMAEVNLMQYSFWVDGSLEFEFEVQIDNSKAQLFWWGTGEKQLIADLQCSVKK